MANTKLPPQAYTREDLAKAYVWVQSQPEYVKNMATGKETLVALYLAARRNGDSSLETIAPVSSRDFKNQLQSLATELDQFEKPEKSKELPKPISQSVELKSDDVPLSFKETPAETQAGYTLDERSQRIIESVKSHLNLESDQEVIRMLLVLGYERAKTIFPNRE